MFTLALFTEERGRHRDAVHVVVQFDPCQFKQGGEHVLKSADVLADFFRRHPAGPSRDEWHADAAFVKVAFHASQRAVTVKKLHLVPSLLMRAIVGTEHHDCVVIDFQFLEDGKNAPHVLIDVVDHPGEAFFLIGDIEVRVTTPVRHAHAVKVDPLFPAGLVVGVRDVECVVGEKRLRLVCAGFADVVHQTVGDQLGCVIDSHLRHAGSLVFWAGALGPPVVVQHISQLHLAAVVNEELGIKIVGMVHVDVAVKLVEAVTLRVVQRRRIANAPLTEAAGLVAVILEHLGKGEVAWL